MSVLPDHSLPISSPDQIDDQILRELYGYWSGLRVAGKRVSRSDIDPIDIPHLLPYIILAECYDAGQRIKFRLTGSDIAFVQGSDLTGRYLHERGPRTPYLEHLSELYRIGAISEDGVYSAFCYGYTEEEGPKKVNRIFLPLDGQGEGPPMLLVGQVRDKTVPTARPIWLTEPNHIEPIALFTIEPPMHQQATRQA
ncbi:PAS domain-containing protein [Denitrobaculum tricleocarpae]|uniref:PAS domain-containing protein n=1 Tax=Denitrobaculum tricleocarpae TaxID=2591009 RepID=A0A545TPT3_9PROT|nr:PAS domain-containing protein [Denitrobaculum tricleocarpae]TQV79235.1 PAS domain-containing protein [Denitrobaculum tricleocarpae]